MTQPTPEGPSHGPGHGSGETPPMSGPLPTGPAYPGPPPPGYAPPPPPQAWMPAATLDAAPGVEKSRLTAGLLGIFLGAFGVHRFYLGYTSMGVLQILVTIATCGIGGFWGFVEGILILNGRGITTDADGRPLRP